MEINATIETNGNLFGDGFGGSGSLEESSLSDDRDQTCVICRLSSSNLSYSAGRPVLPLPVLSISLNFSLSHVSPVLSLGHVSPSPLPRPRVSSPLPRPRVSSPLL
uniref:Uncharacterized protein n=1 Tax=Timema poppense TaxID=170557 RepID=A0A7R9H1Z5_TIMPO|nr:unnamed protein product [Timema poppensis]